MKKFKTNLMLSLAICTGFGTQAYGQTITQPEELLEIYKCKTITENEVRLECYDKAVAGFSEAQESGEIVTVNKTAVEKVKRDAFGFNIPSLPGLGKLFGSKNKKKNDETVSAADNGTESKTDESNRTVETAFDEDIKSVSLEILKTTNFGYNKTRFFLANKQVWEQVGPGKIRKVKGNDGNKAVIDKAALGSFFLRVNGRGSAIRVQRVR